MIEIKNVSKTFDDIQALQQVSAEIQEGSIFGLIGTNGAGKSTLLRMLCGVYKPDQGEILIDGQNVYENEAVKQKVFYISDDQYYLPNSTMEEMARYYSVIYKNFSNDLFLNLTKQFQLNPTRKLSTFSKGMQKRAHIILGLSCQPKYLLCDETFDGLDPVMRQAVKRLLAEAVLEHSMTPIIASHNLRELEDICDHVGLLHQGGVVFEREINQLQENLHKVQCAFEEEKTEEFFRELDIVTIQFRGRLAVMTVRGKKEHTEKIIAGMNPLYYEILPLTLEEIFITEMEVIGYDFKQIIEEK